MSNQRTTQLRKLLAGEVAPGDLIPIIDVSALESGPTGETKAIVAQELGGYFVSSSLANLSLPFQGLQTSNGLAFSQATVPAGDTNKYCYGTFPAVGSNFTLYVRGFIPSNITQNPARRVIFGVGPSATDVADQTSDTAYIGISDLHLIAFVNDTNLIIPNFFLNYNQAFGAALTKDISGVIKLIVNGETVVSSSYVGSVNNTHAVMGNGRVGVSDSNIEGIVYEAHVFSGALTETAIAQLFYGGSNKNQSGLIASYIPDNLNPGPSQWLDSVSGYHLLLPTVGASATNPSKKFTLNFKVDSAGYLGDGSERDVLPEKYILTSCVVESDYKPLLCVGTSSSLAPVSASGTGSWQDNRVPYTSASYGVNPLGIISLGVAHPDRTIYVGFSGSAAPCTFSFEGYVRN
jgi:hypothetical protein